MAKRDLVTLAPDQFRQAPERWEPGDRFFFRIGPQLYMFDVVSDHGTKGLRVRATNDAAHSRDPAVVAYLERLAAQAAESAPTDSNIYWDAVVAVSTP